jgi:folylpolyglutamate synthase/dihydropteroate synthase
MHLPLLKVCPEMSQLLLLICPPGKSCRIPIAVTGTNGKTTTTRLLAHIVKNNGYKVGFTTSDGIYIQNHMMEKEILQVLKVHNMY